LFFLGTIEPRKNLVTLIEAFDKIKKLNDYSRLRLVIAGRNGWLFRRSLRKAQKSPFYRDIIFLGAVENWEKAALYQLSRALVYPSYFEGFGIPPLEAMACGCPVITSNTSSLPEVVGESAFLVNPYRPESLVQALRIILEKPKMAERYAYLGRGRALEVERRIREQHFLELVREFFELKRGSSAPDKRGFSA
jgi:glycosyltransferase involved in cell wall biosynthesis